MIAGLRRIATSLWPHFVALPQRAPVYRHRLRGRAVVIFVDKHSLLSVACNSGRTSGSRAREIAGRGVAPK